MNSSKLRLKEGESWTSVHPEIPETAKICMITKKSICSILIGLLFIVIIASVPAMAQIKVIINNQQVNFDVPPTIIGGRTLVPLRGIFETLGAQVQYNAATRIITASRNGTNIQLALGDTRAYINGNLQTLDVPPSAVQGRTMVPLRFISESLGADVRWLAATQTVIITSGAPAPTPEPSPSPIPEPSPTQTFTPVPTPGATGVQGIVTAVSYNSYPQTIGVRTGNNVYTFVVIPGTVITQTDLSTNTPVPTGLDQIFPGDEVRITTASQSGNTALRVDGYFRSITGIVRSRVPGGISLTDGTVVYVNRNTVYFLNNRQVSFNSVTPGQRVQLRINPSTGRASVVILSGGGGPIGRVNIQSFTHNARNVLRPGDVVTFFMRGTRGGQATFSIPGVVIRRGMNEISPGNYQGSYRISRFDNSVNNVLPVGTLTLPYGTVNARANVPIRIQVFNGGPGRDGIPGALEAPTITAPLPGTRIIGPLIVRGRAVPGAVVDVRVEQVATLGPIGARLETKEQRVQANANGNYAAAFNFALLPRNIAYDIRVYQIDSMGRTSQVRRVQINQR